MGQLEWRKPSRSGANGDNCVEVAVGRNEILVRDSKDPDGGVLAVSAAQWRVFLRSLDDQPHI